MKRWLPVLATGLTCLAIGGGVGWALGPRPGPEKHYCEECREILALQAQGEKLTAIDAFELERLKNALVDKEKALATYREFIGKPPDLHPECECACHRFWVAPASMVYQGH